MIIGSTSSRRTWDCIMPMVSRQLREPRRRPDAPFLRSPLAAPYDTSLAHEQLRYTPKFTMETAILDFAKSLKSE